MTLRQRSAESSATTSSFSGQCGGDGTPVSPERALSQAKELVEVAERLADQDLMLEAYHSRWATSHVSGINSVTLTDTERGIALYDPDRHHTHAYHYGGHDTGVSARAP